jgi:hypothetical protein
MNSEPYLMDENCRHGGPSRRQFLADVGMGFTGLALGSLLHQDGIVRADGTLPWKAPDGRPHLNPKAKNVIWIFLVGGMSHMESFDPKPELTKYAGLTIQESPYKKTLESPYLKKNLREVIEGLHKVHPKIFPLQVGFKKYGQSGIEISDWWSHLGNVIDDVAIVRGMWTTDNNHGAQLQFHTGRHALEGHLPTIGSWVHYGLGTLNDNLPQFVVMGTPIADCCGGNGAHGGNYLGPQHDGIQLGLNPRSALPFNLPSGEVYHEEQERQFGLLNRLNRMAQVEYPDDPALSARIKSYELAFRMQVAVPEVVDLSSETADIHKQYGLDNPVTAPFARQMLVARRLVERGTRFVQVFHGSNGGAGSWDAHSSLKSGHSKLCSQVDQPIGALIADLKRRGLLDDTIVVIGTEFGRTPGAERSDGRDHHPYGFSIALAGGGIKGGVVHGATDELGFHAVEGRHYVTDLHATLLHQLGLDPRRLEIPGRKRLDVDFGQPIREILA